MAKDKQHPAERYAQQVSSKEILTCELVQLAVERYYRDLDNALDKGWYFDRKAAQRAISFIERLKHTKGEWAGQRFRLEPCVVSVEPDFTNHFWQLYHQKSPALCAELQFSCGERGIAIIVSLNLFYKIK